MNDETPLTWRSHLNALGKAFGLLRKNNPLMLASSTAFFTVFSLSPIIIILVTVMSLYFSGDAISDQLFAKIASVFGRQTADQVAVIVENFRSYANQWWIAAGGFVFLVFVATTLLSIVKLSISQIWSIRKKPSRQVRYRLMERGKAAALIVFMGILFLVSLLFDAAVTFLQNYLPELIPSVDVLLIRVVNVIFSLVVVMAFFTILFKFLTDARVRWSVALAGGLLTGVLFNAGKFLLSRLIMYSRMETIFGTSASIALMLLFIFYASFIVYYGAAFTYVFAKLKNKPIRAGKNAFRYEVKEVAEEQAGHRRQRVERE